MTMVKLTIVLSGLLLFGLISCFAIKEKKSAENGPDILASYSKGPCFGKCPVFEFLVFENGEAIYIGEKNVARIGTYTATLDSTQMSTLKNAFEKSGFSSFKGEYLSNISDLPIISIQYRQKVCDFHKRKAPEALWALASQLEEYIEKLEWKKE